jgi:hypothetical protein
MTKLEVTITRQYHNHRRGARSIAFEILPAQRYCQARKLPVLTPAN